MGPIHANLKFTKGEKKKVKKVSPSNLDCLVNKTINHVIRNSIKYGSGKRTPAGNMLLPVSRTGKVLRLWKTECIGIVVVLIQTS